MKRTRPFGRRVFPCRSGGGWQSLFPGWALPVGAAEGLSGGGFAGQVTKGASFAEERGCGGCQSRRLRPQRVCGKLEAFSAGDCTTGTLRKCLRNSNRLVLNLRPSLRALAVLCVSRCTGPGGVEGIVYLCVNFLAEN